MWALLLAAGFWLAYANGANDNFKGVATLLGSDTAEEKGALAWGTITTFAGSVCALLLSGKLLSAFSGEGVVPPELVGNPALLVAVGVGAAAVVMAATRLGLPISTTHALVGGLAGAGVAAVGVAAVDWWTMGSSFALPLLVSPVCAALLVRGVYPPLRALRMRLGVRHDHCVCVGAGAEPSGLEVGSGIAALVDSTVAVSGRTGSADECGLGYEGDVLGITAQRLLDAVHYASAGAVSFARGLNDTPKIAALLLAGQAMGPQSATLAVGGGMAVGAVFHALRVGRTMGHDITPMNAGQGLTANLATALMVLGASRIGVPVSTTHVSTGALFGLGATTRSLDPATFRKILLAWVITLPAAFLTAWTIFPFVAS